MLKSRSDLTVKSAISSVIASGMCLLCEEMPIEICVFMKGVFRTLLFFELYAINFVSLHMTKMTV